jgi:hypothetical protein
MWRKSRSVVASSTPLGAVAPSGLSDLDETPTGLRRVPVAERSVHPGRERVYRYDHQCAVISRLGDFLGGGGVRN